MVDLDVALTVKVCLEDIAVAMVPPPGAQLPVPGAVQHMEEFRMLHANHGEEVLVPQVAPEVVLVSKLLHPRGLQQMAVEWRLAHGLQVQQHHPTVEARESFRRRVPNSGLGVLMTELPESVPVKGKETVLSEFGMNELTPFTLPTLGLHNDPQFLRNKSRGILRFRIYSTSPASRTARA